MRYQYLKVLSGLSLAVLCNPLLAETKEEQRDTWRWTFQAAAVHQFEADLDSGGKVDLDRYFISLAAARKFSDRWQVGIELGFGEDRYDFSGNAGFGALNPWGTIRETRISLPLRYFASGDWTLFAVPSLRMQAERGASLSDGQTGGMLAGAIYRFSENLSIGPGLGVFSEIEDDTSAFPILLINWKLTDTVSLETAGGLAASRGPGLQLNWRPSSNWRFAFGARYEKMRFRLDNIGPAPGGVGQDKSVPLYAMAEYSWSDEVKINFIGGAKVGGNMRLENNAGTLISTSDYDTAPFLGVTFKARF